MPRTRTIAVVTGHRAESGLLRPVMRAIADHPKLHLRVVVAGAHLVQGTAWDLADWGFKSDARVAMQRRGSEGRAADVAALGRGISGFGRAFEKVGPDAVVVLGDRIEALAAATAASVGGFRLAHIHGGDRAEGVADEAMRHAISKLAHLHLPATATSARRLVRMGEWPDAVFRVGSPAADGLGAVEPAADAPVLIVAQHPIGAPDADEQKWMAQTLGATAGRSRLVMAPNGDPGSAGIRRACRAAGVRPVAHMPRPRFLSMLKGARAIVGNSSAGLIEAAVLKTPAVNIGPRQAGREKPSHVIDAAHGVGVIRSAVAAALRLDLRRARHPYGPGNAGERIAEVLATVDWRTVPIRKRNAY